MTVYVYYWGVYHPAGIGPKFGPQQIAEEIRMLRDNNVIGVYYCGGGEDWGLEGPAYWTAGRMMGDPSLDPDALVKDYCDGLYAKAAPAMLRFFNTLYSALEQEMPRLPGCSRAEVEYASRYPPTLLLRLEKLLRAAEAHADSERAKGWVRLTRDAFDYLKINARMYTLYRAYMTNRTPENLLQVKAEVDAWKAWRQKVLGYGRDHTRTWYPGWGIVARFIRDGGHMHSRTGPPVNWDFEKMLERLRKRQQGPPRIQAHRCRRPPKIDGRIDEAPWEDASPHAVPDVGGGGPAAQTIVALLYDDANLYVAFECSEPDVAKMRTDPKGHDADIWNLECVETFLDPTASRTRYMHFIIGSAPGARYDGRMGFDPAATREDKSWNPKWQCAIHIDKRSRRWTAEAAIPFASLGAKPKPGTVWAANFGRERYAGRRNPQLYLWSPNDVGAGFCEPLSFGDIAFE